MDLPNYEREKVAIERFVRECPVVREGLTYSERVEKLAERELRVFDLHVEDLGTFYPPRGAAGLEKGDQLLDYEGLADRVVRNTPRYLTLVTGVLDKLIAEQRRDREERRGSASLTEEEEEDREPEWADIVAIRAARAQLGADAAPNVAGQVPEQLLRRFEVHILPHSKEKAMAIRRIRAEMLGALLTVKGIVTRVTDVKPLLDVATYLCDQCGFEVYQTIPSRTFKPLEACPTQQCLENALRGSLQLHTRGCHFVKHQQMRLQELPEHVPVGNVPRQVTVHLTGDLTRNCKPGDLVSVSGIFIPTPYSGFRALIGMSADTYIHAQHVAVEKQSYTSLSITEEESEEIERFKRRGGVVNRLSQALAPEIFGMEDVKEALLLLLVGGVTKEMRDGMKIRGDINICLMGDPGTAKSQLLRYVAHVSPRGVYTSGKGSSGVGLTAAVLRDPITNEFVLEGGALVLADMGVCCIDEFDKMEDADRTAIHEVMEQQTISVAKAGITTTLNARASVLAAANPVFGRYNLQLKPQQNINLPTALLSRFDLLFIIVDRPSEERDRDLAKHIACVHQTLKPPLTEGSSSLSPAFLRAYISRARQKTPILPTSRPDLREVVKDMYKHMRPKPGTTGADTGDGQWGKRSGPEARDGGAAFHASPRTLLGILRMAQALARLRFSDMIEKADLDEAQRLLEASYRSLQPVEEDEMDRDQDDPVSRVYTIITRLAKNQKTRILQVAAIQRAVISAGFTQQQLDETLDGYEQNGVWHLNPTRSAVHLIQ